MPKDDIFSKLKDYNNVLENVLEQKDFSVDVKNLLLSMLYKIENGYQDYKLVKVDVSSKGYFLQKIVNIIKECKEIKFVKPLSEESKILEEQEVNYIVDREESKIICYPNERIILEALVTLNQNQIELEEQYGLYQRGILETLYRGSRMSIVEVLRDFNGWSWDITTNQMESKNLNLIYQNLNILFGNKFMQKWLTGSEEEEIDETDIPNNEILKSKYNSDFGMTVEEVRIDNKIDYIQKMYEKLKNIATKENTEEFIKQFKKTMIVVGYNYDDEQKELILKEKDCVEEQLNKMKDNRKYLEELTEKKKQIRKQIKYIDELLSDDRLLKEEYDKRNSTLENKNKIFSVSHLRIMLEKERENNLNKIKKYDDQMKPQEFVNIKNRLEEEYKDFEDIGLGAEKADLAKQIVNLQICFLKCFMDKIKMVENKSDIKDLVYELRYYEQLPYKDTIISNTEIEELNEKIEEAERLIIEKACKEKILTTFSNNEKLNKQILANQFSSKIINLENTNYLLKYHKGILNIIVYDTNVEDEEKEVQILEKVELQVRLNKKIQIWE